MLPLKEKKKSWSYTFITAYSHVYDLSFWSTYFLTFCYNDIFLLLNSSTSSVLKVTSQVWAILKEGRLMNESWSDLYLARRPHGWRHLKCLFNLLYLWMVGWKVLFVRKMKDTHTTQMLKNKRLGFSYSFLLAYGLRDSISLYNEECFTSSVNNVDIMHAWVFKTVSTPSSSIWLSGQ